MLKWTYAYGYYSFDPWTVADGADVPAAEAAAAAAAAQRLAERKDFFEFLQCDAETSLELLSKAVEQDCKPFYSRAELLRQGRQRPGGAARAEVRALPPFGRLCRASTAVARSHVAGQRVLPSARDCVALQTLRSLQLATRGMRRACRRSPRTSS